jgi:SAM-dependent methyltransferase
VSELLRPLLTDPYRPVRLAAAAALAACQKQAPDSDAALLADAEPAPARIGDSASTVEWLSMLAREHEDVLGHRPGPAADARGRAEWLAGPVTVDPTDVREAEIQRYVQGKERHYNLTKPFTVGSHQENIWLLHSFLVVAENLLAPRQGMVLDLGGGAGWVSELLAKLGYKPVTLDISAPLISVGRERFQRESLTARFVAGDMTSLPFASGTFEAVVVIDALHHVPDVPAVFREAHRVLAQGGQFLLAEPAEGHAESAISRREKREHGICEREIHLFEAARYGEQAGFDACAVIPHFIPALAMTPSDLRLAMSQPAERWNIKYGGRPAAFDEYFLQGILCHPILAFAKGERRLDSRLPGRLQAQIEPALVRRGREVSGTVRITNRGDTLWLGGGDTAGSVRLGFQLLTPDRHLLDLDYARASLPEDLPPGQTRELRVAVSLPAEADPYVLKLDMVAEHICWFEDTGSPVVYLAV